MFQGQTDGEASLGGKLVLTPTEAARLLRIGRGTAYEQIRCGTIPSIRLGRRILVPRAALMKMLETTESDKARR